MTGVRDFTYRYIFDRHDDLCEPRHPFYILELNAGLKQPRRPIRSLPQQ